MPSTLLLTFDSDTERGIFLNALNIIADGMSGPEGTNLKHQTEGWEQRKETGEFIQKVIKTAKFDPPIKGDHERECALFVAGEKILEGKLTDLNRRFDQEVGVHSGSVQIREKKNGDGWKVIRSRMKQQQ